MNNVLTYKNLVGYTYYLKLAIARKGNNIINIGAITYKVVLLHAHAHKAVFVVDIQLGIVGHYLLYLDLLYRGNFCFSFFALTIFFKQSLKISYGKVGQVFQIKSNLFELLLQTLDVFIGFKGVILGNPLDTDLGEFGDVFFGKFAH